MIGCSAFPEDVWLSGQRAGGGAAGRAGCPFLAALGSGVAAYLASGLVVALGVALGVAGVVRASPSPSPRYVPLRDPAGACFLDALTQWDGQRYIQIAQEGYTYDPERRSRVAFFPFYPLLGRYVTILLGVPPDIALVAVSQVFLLGAMVVAFDYVRRREAQGGGNEDGERGKARARQQANGAVAAFSVLALAFFPTSFFSRMIYTESLFVFLCVLALRGMQGRWPLVLIAGTVGLATAARSVGVALVPPLLLYIWRHAPSPGIALRRSLWVVPLALSGLLAYMAFLAAAFDEPLAFVKTQEHWRLRPRVDAAEKALALASSEPIWSVYEPSSLAYWRRWDPHPGGLLRLQFANAIFFVAVVALILVGCWRGWLSAYETLLAAALLLVPYVTHAYETCMVSQARYAFSVFPVYLVLGNLLSRLPTPLAIGLLGVSAAFLGIYSALFAAGYSMI
jgi:hypothetical protein